VVGLADEIAQRHHDIEDCLRYGLINRTELLSQLKDLLKGCNLLPESKQNLKALEDGKDKSLNEFLPLFSRFIVNFLVVDAIQNTKIQLKDFGIRNRIGRIEDFVNCKSEIAPEQHKERVSFSPAVDTFDQSFEKYLTKNVLGAYEAQALDGKGAFIIRRLFSAYVSNPYQLPDSVIAWFYHDIQKPFDRSSFTNDIVGNEATFVRVLADFIGGMTDGYAYSQYDLLYGTRV
jgi:dGTPase